GVFPHSENPFHDAMLPMPRHRETRRLPHTAAFAELVCCRGGLDHNARVNEERPMEPVNEPRVDLILDEPVRRDLWRRVVEIIEDYASRIGGERVTPELDLGRIRADAGRFGFP